MKASWQYLHAAVFTVSLASASSAKAGDSSLLIPDQFFVQAGKAEDAAALSAGLIWQSGGAVRHAQLT